jgi:V-type H+-transporting ATPase subunit C
MYWLVSLPLVEAQDRIWSRLQSKTVYEADLSQTFRFELPELRVGTLDSLMVLSDDLVKVSLHCTERVKIH